MQSYPVKTDLDMESLEYATVLRGALSSFAGPGLAHNIWCAALAPHSEQRHLLVPKVTRKQLDNVVYWTAKKEMPFDESKVTFDYLLHGEIMDKGVPKYSVLAYTVPKVDLERYTGLFARAGYPLSGLTLPPFANQNLFKSGWLKPGDENIAILYIGRDWSRIEIFLDGNLILLRGIKAGVQSMEETLLDAMKEKARNQSAAAIKFSQPAAQGFTPEFELEEEPLLILDDKPGDPVPVFELSLEAPLQTAPEPEAQAEPAARRPAAMDINDARKTLYSLIPGMPQLEQNDPGFGISQNEIIEMSMPALERLLRQIEMTFKHYSSALGRGNIGKLYVIGSMGGNRPLIKHINEQLAIECLPLDPISQRKDLAPSEAAQLPPSDVAGTIFCQSIGLALSDNSRTPNLLFTFLNKAKERQDNQVVRTLMAGFAAALALLLGLIFWQQWASLSNVDELAALKAQKAQLGVTADANHITLLSTKAVLRQNYLRAFAERNLGLASIGAVCTLTPENINLFSITLDLGKPASAAAKAPPAKEPGLSSKTLVLDGVVRGEPQLFEAALASYVLKLRNCQFFDDPTVSSKNVETLPDGSTALRFLITITIT